MKDIYSVADEAFSLIVRHFEKMCGSLHQDLSDRDFVHYLIGLEFALNVAFDLDFDSFCDLVSFVSCKFCDYFNFGGKKSE